MRSFMVITQSYARLNASLKRTSNRVDCHVVNRLGFTKVSLQRWSHLKTIRKFGRQVDQITANAVEELAAKNVDAV